MSHRVLDRARIGIRLGSPGFSVVELCVTLAVASDAAQEGTVQ